MKKIVLLVILLAPCLVSTAQKPIKPNLSKAEKSWREGKYEEAKSIIDATTTSQEFMVDKKGNPTKNAAKAWYLKGIIYAAIDTTKNQAAKGLVENPLSIAMEAFAKCYELSPGKKSYIFQANGIEPLPDTTLRAILAQHYLIIGIKYYKEDKDYKKAFAEVEKVVAFIPWDTTQLMNAGVYFGPAASDWEKSIEYTNRYFAKGGKQDDAFAQMLHYYFDVIKDNVKTLEMARKARAAHPGNSEYPKYELNVYLRDKKYDLARNFVQEGLTKNPNDKEGYYLLGGLYKEMGNLDSAKLAYQNAIKLDESYSDAQYDLSVLIYLDAKKIKSERDKLGITPKDIQQRKVLFDQLQAKYKVALPYWEKCLKLMPENETVLFTLSEIYGALVMDEKAEVITKKMKALKYID